MCCVNRVSTRRLTSDRRLSQGAWLSFVSLGIAGAILIVQPAPGLAASGELAVWEARLRTQYQVETLQFPEEMTSGRFFVAGDLMPRSLRGVAGPAGPRPEPRRVAAEFLSENAGFLGVDDPAEELRERSVDRDLHGRTHLSYTREVSGLPLEEAEVLLHFEPDGTLSAFQGVLVSVTPEMRQDAAIADKGLDAEAARSIALRDLLDSGQRSSVLHVVEARRFVTSARPHIIWKVEVAGNGESWKYRIDAFTGAILEKRLNVQSHESGEIPPAHGEMEIHESAAARPLEPPASAAEAAHVADLIAWGWVAGEPESESAPAQGREHMFVPVHLLKGRPEAERVLVVSSPPAAPTEGGGMAESLVLTPGETYILFLRRTPWPGRYELIGGAAPDQWIDRRLRTAAGEPLDQVERQIRNLPGMETWEEEPADATLTVSDATAVAPAPVAEEERTDPQSRTAAATQNLLTEGFEGSFPSGSWNVFDNNGSTGGQVYWDDTSYQAYAGSWSAWCADGGTNRVSPGSNYPASMDSWMVYGPFDLREATSATLSFRYWLRSEQGYDHFKYMASVNGSQFHGTALSGSSGGWSSRSLDLGNVPNYGSMLGDSSVWIAFIFTSDSSFGDLGAYVDEVRVEKTVSAPADLKLELVDVASGTYAPGGAIDIHNRIVNIGGQTSTSYRISFYASTNTTISSSDYLIGYIDRTGIAASGAHDYNSSGVVPGNLPDGSYYIGAILTLSDADSANNVNYDPNPVTVRSVPPADLALQSVDAPSGTFTPNQSITINNQTQNVGGETSSSYRLTFYASTNATITTSDYALFFVDRQALAPGATHSFATTGSLPGSLPAGAYYIGAILSVTDANSVNNTNYDPNPITVTVETAGPKIGRGTGVLGTLRSHLDTYYDTFLGNEYFLDDVTRRSSQNVHGHNGQMASGASIKTQEWGLIVNTTLSDTDNIWSAADQASGVDAHAYAAKVYDFQRSRLGINSFDRSGSSMQSVVESGSLTSCPDNAYWDASSNRLFYCAGSRYLPLSGALDVAGHEWGHALTDEGPGTRRDDLLYEKESGALNEAFSDWFGTAVEHHEGETNWTMGEGIVEIRDLSDPHDHSQPDTYRGTYWVPVDNCTPERSNDYCGVHTNSGVPNKMFYLLSQGSSGESNGAFNNVVVSGLGIDTAIHVATDANLYYWVRTETFLGARNGMASAAAAYGANAQKQVRNAWAAVGVGNPPDLQLVSVDAPSGRFRPGTALTVANLTTNRGEATSTPYRINFYASTNTSISTQDTLLGGFDRGSLDAGASHSLNSTVTLPATLPLGTWYIGAILTLADGNASNNTGYDPVAITVANDCNLTLSASPSQGGAVGGGGTYTCGANVTATASPAAGWVFTHWSESGAWVSGSSSYAFPLPGNRQLIAHFKSCNLLSLAHSGQGGNPTVLPASSPGCASGRFLEGTRLSLTASPSAGWWVSSWSGTDNNGGTALTNTATMPAGSHSVTVSYSTSPPACYALSKGAVGSGSVPLASPSSSPGCSSNQYHAGEAIRLTASPSTGWRVAGWTGTNNDGAVNLENTLVMPARSHSIAVRYQEILAGDLYTVVPCRLLDTRGNPPLSSGVARTIPITGCGIPAGAKAIAINVTVVDANGSGYMVFYPTGEPTPVASTISFQAGVARANNSVQGLSAGGSLNAMAQVLATGGTVHLIIDVTGYFF